MLSSFACQDCFFKHQEFMETLSGAEILVFWRYKYLCHAFHFVKKKLDSQTEALMMRYYYRANKSMPINQFLKLPTVFFLVQLCKKSSFIGNPSPLFLECLFTGKVGWPFTPHLFSHNIHPSI